MFSSNIFHALDDGLYQPIIWPLVSQRHRRANMWTASVDLHDFKPNEVQIKEVKGDGGEVKIIVHAKHEVGEDSRETKKTVKIPADVADDKLRTIFSEEGLLILKAPYREMAPSSLEPLKIHRDDTWNGVWGEMARLSDHMQILADSNGALRFPRTEFVANKDGGEDGVWRMHVNIGKGFRPDEVKLRSHDNCIKLEAKKEVKGDHGVSSRYISEVVSIPEGVDQDQLKSKFFENGDLTLEAPCKKVPKTEEYREGKAIPIEVGKSGAGEKMAVDQ